MSTQYRLVQSGKTASGGCSAGQGSSEPVAPWIYFIQIDSKHSVMTKNCGIVSVKSEAHLMEKAETRI
jgi:hypothetical protein